MDNDFFCIADNPENYYDCFMNGLVKRNPGEPEFHQAVGEVAKSIIPYVFEHRKYLESQILERMTEPDRIVSFRVCWEDDSGNTRTNRGYRVQFNNSIGPYKGGLRFHSSVNQSILKFLGFEQIFKNSLTTLPIGAAKGGANFNPQEKSDREIMRFCQAFMTALYRHIGKDIDVPAGDIGVGAREISYMFGQYKRIQNHFVGVLTGKGVEFGGSLIRKEATGYGLIYFANNVLEQHSQGLKGQACLVSGSGNVSQYAAHKLLDFGAKIISMSDSRGVLHVPDGITPEILKEIEEVKLNRGSLEKVADNLGLEFIKGAKPWEIPCDYAFPCATQNEISIEDAQALKKGGCQGVFEGANMPSSNEAIEYFLKEKILFAPGKAANAGGVAISALEMTQNSIRMSWSRDEVDQKLQEIMKKIHDQCVQYGGKQNPVNYVDGANIAGFVKVADAMLAYGIH